MGNILQRTNQNESLSGPPGDLAFQLLRFARILKDQGLPVTLGRTLGAIRGLGLISLAEKEELFVLLSAHFVSRPEELLVFEKLFNAFWSARGDQSRGDRGNKIGTPLKLPLEILPEENGAAEKSKRRVEALSYSPEESLKKKDFAKLSEEEAEEVNQVILSLSQNIGGRLSRRYTSGPKGRKVDLSGTLRRSLRYGGELLILKKKRRRLKKHRFVVLCDVSGSMDRYSRFLLQFLYGFQKKIPRVETFVFSTRLSRITELLRLRDMNAAYTLISEKVKDWSGGTRIGSSLWEYNRRYGGKYSSNRTIFILLSDGWDRGETSLLEEEMRALKRRVYRLMWLNPLLGLPNYRPLDRGMRTALPYTDEFLDCHDLEKLEEFGRTLEKVCSA